MTHFIASLQGIPHKILTITSPNQFNICDTILLNPSKKNSKIQTITRLLIEDPLIRKRPMTFSQNTLIQLLKASNECLSSWAKKHHLVISKVDYVAKKVFRTDPYTLFVCDLPQKEKNALEKKLVSTRCFSSGELDLYTKGAWWEAIDIHPNLQGLCYRALRTLKESPARLSLEDCSKILNYCGYKLQPRRCELYTSRDFQKKGLFLLNKIASMNALPLTKKHKQRRISTLATFMKTLPLEDRIIYDEKFSEFPTFFFSLQKLNQLWLDQEGSNALLARPAAGISHRNRFSSCIDRPLATFIPNLKTPNNLHNLPCSHWLQISCHDALHQTIYSTNPYREAWVHLASYLFSKTRNLELYNKLLDRDVLVLDIRLTALNRLKSFCEKNAISQTTQDDWISHFHAWYHKHCPHLISEVIVPYEDIIDALKKSHKDLERFVKKEKKLYLRENSI